ncbi:MAG: ABC transporter permease, partial [Actinomycetota bacterium]|nr:ABC transporter permease [Actinomycetota bacterium]
GPIYTSIEGSMADFGDALPEQLLALFGGGDMSTPEGFYQLETFGMVAPIALMVVTITIAAKALAGEEENRTMGLLLANPVSRRTVVAQKAITMVLFGGFVGLAIFAGTALGVLIGGVDLNLVNLAATCVLVTLIGLLFGALSLVISAATGRVALAIFIPVGAALLFHTMNALASLSDAWWGALSPFHYYLGNDPLNNGMDWGGAAVLTVLTIALIALAFPAFDRAEVREHA